MGQHQPQPLYLPTRARPPPAPLLLCVCPQDLTPRAKDSLVSFGERLSTRLFAAYLCAQGVAAKQYDAYAIGVTTSDNFVNAEVRGWRGGVERGVGWVRLAASWWRWLPGASTAPLSCMC